MSNTAVAISGGGGKRGVIEYMVDGIPNLTGGGQPYSFVPSIDTVDEIKVQTTLFDAAYGHSDGGAVNITTRGGTNDLHGAGYIYKRWDALNAADWPVNKASQPKPLDDFRLWGFAVSGPVYLPKIFNGKNRTFFSVTFEQENTHFPQSFLAHMPTALERAGDFSQTLSRNGKGIVTIYDPATTVIDSSGNVTRQPFPGSRIPAERQTAIGQAVLNSFALPNAQTGQSQVGANNWAVFTPLNFKQRQYTVRLDHKINDRNRMFARFSRPLRDQFTPPSFVGESTNHLNRNFVSAALDDSFIISPSLVGSIRYGYARFLTLTVSGEGLDPAAIHTPDVITANQVYKGYPNFSLGEGFRPFGSNQSGTTRDLHSLLGSLNKLSGNHSLKVGADYRLLRLNNFATGGSSTGAFTVTGAFTTANPLVPTSLDTSGTSMASMLLGLPASGGLGATSPVSVQSHYLGAYIQDDWKVTPSLTLNFGLRYEVETPYTERYNRVTYGFDGTVKSPLQVPGYDLRGGLLFTGINGLPRREGTVDGNNFGPRFGFAYSLNSRTVLRGGYGIFFSPITFNSSFLGEAAVFSASTPFEGTTNGATIANTLANPFPNGFRTPVGSSAGLTADLGNAISFWNTDVRSPYNQQWQVGVQRQLPFGLVVDASYVGMLSLKQLESFNLNELPDVYLAQGSAQTRSVPNPFFGLLPSTTSLGSGPTVQQRQLWLRYPQYTSVTLQGANTGRAVYHALQTNISKKLSHYLSFNVSYAFSKLMTTYTTSVVNERHYRTIGAIDQPHVLRLSAMYELPFRMHSRASKLFLEGWRIDSFVQVESGLPLSISQANGRPIRIRDASIHTPVGDRLGDQRNAAGVVVNPYFDVNAFQPLPNQFTVSPEPPYFPELRDPQWRVVNAGLGKTVPIRDSFKVEVRAQAWNLLNSPIFAAPGTNMSSPSTFGVITGLKGDGDARRIEGSLRLSF